MSRWSMITAFILLGSVLDVSRGQAPECSLTNRTTNQTDDVCSNERKLARFVDLVFVLDASNTVSDKDYTTMINTVRQFPDLAEMSKGHVRVAVVTYSSEANVALEFTADEGKVRNLTDKRSTIKGGTRTHEALSRVLSSKQVFARARFGELRVVVLISNGMPTVADETAPDGYRNDTGPTEQEAARLRDMDLVMFAVYVGEMTPDIRKHLETVTDDPSYVMPVANFGDLAVVIKQKLRKEIACAYENFDACYFDANMQCVWEGRRPNDTERCCTNHLHPSNPKLKSRCANTQFCVRTCGEWGWKQCRQSDAGQYINVTRIGIRPVDKKFAYCEDKMTVYCPPNERGELPPTETTTTPTPSTRVSVPPSACRAAGSDAFGIHVQNVIECVQSEGTQDWIKKMIQTVIHNAKEAEASGSMVVIKYQIEECLRRTRGIIEM